MSEQNMRELGQAVIDIEAQALLALRERINDHFVKACQTMLQCQGRVIVTGMGKSGHIGNKIAATLASTGTPSFFVHPGEASHGDLGMITKQDVVIGISYSGETNELLTILPILKRLGVPMIAMTGNPNSKLALESDIFLDVSVDKEACPHNLAPTASTTAALAMGDALAVALLDQRRFTPEDFARSHPGGSLGRRLLIHVEDLMHTGDAIPKVTLGTPITQALVEMSEKRLGMTAVVNPENQVIGVFTDGDLRRALDADIDLKTDLIDRVMTSPCKTIRGRLLAAEALHIMDESKINGLLVTDESQQLLGALNMHDLLRAGVV